MGNIINKTSTVLATCLSNVLGNKKLFKPPHFDLKFQTIDNYHSKIVSEDKNKESNKLLRL